MKKEAKHLILLSVFIFGLFLSVASVQALTISPAKIVLSADPGEIIETKMKVGHGLKETIAYFPVFENYTVKNGEEPMYMPADFGLATWIETDPEELILGPGETKTATVRINVPEDAAPGGHYAVLFWSNSPPEKGSGSGVGIITRVGALIFLEVSGDVTESGKIVDLEASSKFIRNLPISFSFPFVNDGNVHLLPTGEIAVKDIFGKTVAVLNANPAQAYVLPDTTRVILTQAWEPEKDADEIEGRYAQEEDEGFLVGLRNELKDFRFGYYKANLVIEYGQDRTLARDSIGFWIIPWQSLLIGLFILGIALLMIVRIIKIYSRPRTSSAIKKVNQTKRRSKNG